MSFNYLSSRSSGVRQDHPLRPIRAMVDQVLRELSPEFAKMHSKAGRPSIPPEQLLRALLLQMHCTGAQSKRHAAGSLDQREKFSAER